MMDVAKLDRVVLIDHRWEAAYPGIVFEQRDVHVRLEVQDDGRTLKVFVT